MNELTGGYKIGDLVVSTNEDPRGKNAVQFLECGEIIGDGTDGKDVEVQWFEPEGEFSPCKSKRPKYTQVSNLSKRNEDYNKARQAYQSTKETFLSNAKLPVPIVRA